VSKLFKIKKCYLTVSKPWCHSFLVTFPVSYRYNGGIVIDDEWYAGYEVPPPVVPAGFELVGIGCGLQLNARPPYATQYLRPLVPGRKVSKHEVVKALAEAR
jgi:hypothetical protein